MRIFIFRRKENLYEFWERPQTPFRFLIFTSRTVFLHLHREWKQSLCLNYPPLHRNFQFISRLGNKIFVSAVHNNAEHNHVQCQKKNTRAYLTFDRLKLRYWCCGFGYLPPQFQGGYIINVFRIQCVCWSLQSSLHDAASNVFIAQPWHRLILCSLR